MNFLLKKKFLELIFKNESKVYMVFFLKNKLCFICFIKFILIEIE